MTTDVPTVAPVPPPPGFPPGGPPRPRGPRHLVRNLAIAAGAVVVALVVVAAVVLHHLNTPAAVPRSWTPPEALPGTSAVVPAGHLVFDSNRTGNYEIWTMAGAGGGARQLTDDPAYDSFWGRPSPDRRTILFYRTPAGVHDRDYSKASLWEMAADGSGQVELRPAGLDGWVVQGHAEWSPGGRHLVMFGGSRFHPQIWVTDALGRHPRAVTTGGYSVDPSWSPDGRFIVYAGCPSAICPPGSHEVYTVPAAGGPASRLTHDQLADYDPYFSHDGRQLAWLTKLGGGLLAQGVWDIRIVAVHETGSRLVTAAGARPRLLVPDRDGAVNSKPSWSADDRTIFFHRALPGVKGGFQIWAVGSDGRGLHELTFPFEGANEYPGT